jgi:hypothetical protein
MRLNGHKVAAMGMAICLLALLVHPTAASVAALAAVILVPLVLFGLVVAPRSLWPVVDVRVRCTSAVPCRAALFQRPPPSSLR